MKIRDPFVITPSFACVAAVVSAAILSTTSPSPAHACSPTAPGILARSVWPGPDQHPPINARLVVTYDEVGAVGFGPDVPPLGQDIALLDAGQALAVSIEMAGQNVILRPNAPLLPGHTYDIADRRTIPCYASQGNCALLNEPLVFTSFTTANVADATPPTFRGLASVAVGANRSCDDTACCGPYSNYPVHLSWPSATDDQAGVDLRYNVYRRGDGTSVPTSSSLVLVAGLVSGTVFTGGLTCSGTDFGGNLTPGTYVVRAVDWAGLEDMNRAERSLGDACKGSDAGCAVAGVFGSSRAGAAWLLVGLVCSACLRRRRRTNGLGRCVSVRLRGRRQSSLIVSSTIVPGGAVAAAPGF